MAEHLVLVGMMGAGKTTVGRRLASALGWVYLDSDEQVEAATGRTVRELFEEHGEAAFRREEQAALQTAAARPDSAVISVAGGAVLDAANREVIQRAGFTVWLRASLATLTQRVGDGRGRPLLGDDPGAALQRLLPQRASFYEQLADAIVDVDGRSVDEVVDEILLRRREGARS